MGDLPLRTPTDRSLGGPLPRQQANQTHPHPSPPNLWSSFDVGKRRHTVLGRLSTGYPVVMGRLDTRYSPVRQSSSRKASFPHVTLRLACVKPVASVHPEPGSNSPLYNIVITLLNKSISYFLQHTNIIMKCLICSELISFLIFDLIKVDILYSFYKVYITPVIR